MTTYWELLFQYLYSGYCRVFAIEILEKSRGKFYTYTFITFYYNSKHKFLPKL